MKLGFKAISLCAALAAALIAPAPAQDGGNDPAGAVTRSDALFNKGDYAGARAELEAAVKGGEAYYPVVLRYAYLAYLLKDYAAAADSYAKAAQLGPKEEAPLTGLMNTALARQDLKWKDYAASLLAMNPSNYAALSAFAYDDYTAKRYQRAADRFEKLFALNSYDVNAKLMLGWSRLYLGDYSGARAEFETVLGWYPDNASAKEGLKSLPKTFTFGAGFCYAGLDYKSNPYKKNGYYLSMPLTLGIKEKLSLSFSYAYTYLNWVPPVKDSRQEDRNFSLAYVLKPGLVARAAYDHIANPDNDKNLGDVLTGGGDYSAALGDGHYLVAGGWVSRTKYPRDEASQVSPHAGIGRSGWWYADVFLHSISSKYHDADGVLRNNKVSSAGLAVALGPYFDGLVLNGQAYSGEKRFMVDGWGTVIANAPDLYRGGWKLGASYLARSASCFVVYGSDKVRAYYGAAAGTVNYTAAVLAAGANLKF